MHSTRIVQRPYKYINIDVYKYIYIYILTHLHTRPTHTDTCSPRPPTQQPWVKLLHVRTDMYVCLFVCMLCHAMLGYVMLWCAMVRDVCITRVCVYAYAHVYCCMSTYVDMCVCMYVCMCVCMYDCMYVCM